MFRFVSNVGELEHSVLARERAMSTGFGRGVAISHGESADVERITVALGLSEKGVDYDAWDGKPVHILFLVVNGVHERVEYLDVLSTLTALLRRHDVRDRLRCCTCAVEVESMLKEALALHGR